MDIFRRKTNQSSTALSARKLMGITLICLVGASLISTAVYMISGYIQRFSPAFFESVSAFTTTGATVFPYPMMLPAWVKVFRAACQWIGGGGTLVFLACMLSNMDAINGGFSHAASADGALYRTGLRFVSIVRRLLLTYLIMTVTCFLLLWASGVNAFNSLCFALSTISTGGFVPDAALNSGISETVIVLFMIFTCVNYTLYYHAIRKHFDKFDKNSELNALLWIMIGGAVLVSGSLLISGTYDFRGSVENGIFHTVSSLTTTGYIIADTTKWPSFAKAVLTMLSFIGGSTCSLGSGIKIMRVIVVLRLISASFTVRIHPKAVVTTKINERSIPSEVASSMGAFFATYFAFYIIGAFVIGFEAPDILSCFTVSAALLNNVGTPFASGFTFTNLSWIMHLLMSVLMIAGRLELYAVLLPFSRNKND